jgi:hypothetical protein
VESFLFLSLALILEKSLLDFFGDSALLNKVVIHLFI